MAANREMETKLAEKLGLKTALGYICAKNRTEAELIAECLRLMEREEWVKEIGKIQTSLLIGARSDRYMERSKRMINELGRYPSTSNSNSEVFTAMPTGQGCPYCSGNNSFVIHSGVCPKVRAIEYFPDGSIKRVEFKED